MRLQRTHRALAAPQSRAVARAVLLHLCQEPVPAAPVAILELLPATGSVVEAPGPALVLELVHVMVLLQLQVLVRRRASVAAFAPFPTPAILVTSKVSHYTRVS